MAILKNNVKNNFTIIPNHIITAKINPNSLKILLLLYSKPADWRVNQKNIAKELGIDISTVKRGIKELKEKKYIIIEKKPNKNKGFIYNYILNLDVEKDEEDTPNVKKEKDTPDEKEEDTMVEKNNGCKVQRLQSTTVAKCNLLTNTDYTKTNNTNIKKEKYKKEKNKNFIDLAVDCLNEITNSNFKKDNKNTVKNLLRLKKEKFTIEDIKKVITFKNSEWKNDNVMKKYLRPQTLFSNKFINYLEETENIIETEEEKIIKNWEEKTERKEVITTKEEKIFKNFEKNL